MSMREITTSDEDVKSIMVTITDAATGNVIGEAEMGPNADYVLITAPKFELAHRQVYANGTIQLTIRKHLEARS